MRSLTRCNAVSMLTFVALLLFTIVPSVAATVIFNAAPVQPSVEPAWREIALCIAAVLSPVVGIAALFVSYLNTKTQVSSSEANANSQRWRDANQKEIEQLEELLHNFHVPYLVRAEANNNMAQDLRYRFDDPNYRMLIKLFDPTWRDSLSDGDRALVDEVCKTGIELKKFIEERGGSVDAKLVDHLARASTHFRILSLAHDGKLGIDPRPFERYVYPRQLDLAIEADRNRILERLALLRAKPSENHGLIKPLELPEDAQLDAWPNPVRPIL